MRFESVNYRSRVWLNGKPVGENTGAYIPVQFQLSGLKRKGTNRLVVRVDSRRLPTDFPPSGLNTDGVPTGGWWNYGGILREVYLQKPRARSTSNRSRYGPCLPCGTCAADVQMRIALRNVTSRLDSRSGSPEGSAAKKVSLGEGDQRGRRSGLPRTLQIKPRLWTPQTPNLYTVHFTVTADGKKVAGYDLHSSVRSIKVSNGRLVLNGAPVHFRGMFMHEDDEEGASRSRRPR